MQRYRDPESELAQRLEWRERSGIVADRRRVIWPENSDLVGVAQQVRGAWQVRPPESWLCASKGRILERFDHLIGSG